MLLIAGNYTLMQIKIAGMPAMETGCSKQWS